MQQQKHKISFLGLICILRQSCWPYQKALKSEDVKLKYDMAEAYYDEGDFRRAKGLFEQLKPIYMQRKQPIDIGFHFVMNRIKIVNHLLWIIKGDKLWQGSHMFKKGI